MQPVPVGAAIGSAHDPSGIVAEEHGEWLKPRDADDRQRVGRQARFEDRDVVSIGRGLDGNVRLIHDGVSCSRPPADTVPLRDHHVSPDPIGTLPRGEEAAASVRTVQRILR